MAESSDLSHTDLNMSLACSCVRDQTVCHHVYVFSGIIQGDHICLSESAEEEVVWKFIRIAVPLSATL
jgi:hypothetical protein